MRWPASGRVQRFAGVAMDQFYHLREDRDQLIPLKRPTLALAAMPAAHPEHSHHGAAGDWAEMAHDQR